MKLARQCYQHVLYVQAFDEAEFSLNFSCIERNLRYITPSRSIPEINNETSTSCSKTLLENVLKYFHITTPAVMISFAGVTLLLIKVIYT